MSQKEQQIELQRPHCLQHRFDFVMSDLKNDGNLC